jgi:translation initiation factor eIF-2B subunit delta
VCCESYKFLDKVLLNSITKNELGDPRDLSCPLKCEGCTSALEGNSKGISLLNPIYDVTPAHFITILISEVGKIPPTSVPIIIREFKKEIIYEE